MALPDESDKKSKKLPDDDVHEIADDDDEETRLRDRLLARRAQQLKEMIAAETVDASEERQQQAGSDKKSSHRHHHHKKKKRRHESVERTDEAKFAEEKTSDRIPSVASAVAIAHSTGGADAFGGAEEEGLTIRPPQVISSGESKRSRRSREGRSPDYKKERTFSRYRSSDNYESERGKRDKAADEGWSHWKKSLDHPWGRGGRGAAAAAPLHGGRGHSRSPPSKLTSSRHDHRTGGSSQPPPPSYPSSGRWLPTKSGVDRPSSSRYHQQNLQSGRSDKSSRDDVRGESLERAAATAKGRVREERRQKDTGRGESRPEESIIVNKGLSTGGGISLTSLVAVTSPETTPTMDEADDAMRKDLVDSPRESGEQRSRSRSPSPARKNLAGSTAAVSNASTRSHSLEGRKSRSSMESGEHRSEDEADTKKRSLVEEQSGSKSEVKRIKYSKFESSSSSSESESEGDLEDRETPMDAKSEEAEAQLETPLIEYASVIMDVEEPSPELDYESTLPVYYPALMGCRSVEEFQSLNRIEEGTYGVVYRAKEKRTDEIVALKRLKMEKEKEGFPITSLREINMLLKAGNHRNIVKVREIVVGSNMDKIYLVMDYVEHDLKSLMETMRQPFMMGEIKTLLKQLLAGVKHLHDNWILHRDLKTSNLLLSHKGVLKIADFGLAREYGDPLKPYTPIVVTLWYRAPELLLGIKKYSTPIDMWSVGCIFAEMLTLKPFFTGKSEIEQLSKIFKVLGTPNEQIWPGYSELPGVKVVDSFAAVKYNSLRKSFGITFSDSGLRLLNRLLCYDPEKRVTASEALQHDWFAEEPRPVNEDMFPTWPAKSEQSRAPKKGNSPKPPSGGKQFFQQAALSDKDYMANLKKRPAAAAAPGFNLKFDAPKF